jgi:acyl dehydratase
MTLITRQMRAQIGRQSLSYRMRLESEDMLRFARTVEAREPWLVNDSAGQSNRFKELVAAPTYLIVMRELEARALIAANMGVPISKGVDGGSAWEFLEPLHAGDTVTAVARVADYYERQTSLGDSLFQVLDITYRNSEGRVVVRQRDTRIFYR